MIALTCEPALRLTFGSKPSTNKILNIGGKAKTGRPEKRRAYRNKGGIPQGAHRRGLLTYRLHAGGGARLLCVLRDRRSAIDPR